MKRTAVVGAGMTGRCHASAYKSISRTQLVAVCDPVFEVAQRLAADLSVEAYTSIGSMLEAENLDVVSVCTPTDTHFSLISAIAEAGVNVVSEKPLCRNVTEAKAAISVCDKAGVKLFAAQAERWSKNYRKLRDLIKNGAIGEPVIARTSRCSKHPTLWFENYEKSGGVVLDTMVDDFDWLRWCFGDVKRVYARGLIDAGISATDYALITLRFFNGMIAHVEGSWAQPTGSFHSVEVAGTQGLLSFSSDDVTCLTIEKKLPDGDTQRTSEAPTSFNSIYAEIEHFVDCLENRTEAIVSGRDGMEAVRIAEAATRSIREGRPVDMEDVM